MILVEGREVMAVAYAEPPVFLEEGLFHVEPRCFARVGWGVAFRDGILGSGVLEELRVAHPLRELYELPEVRPRLSRRIDHLLPEVGPALCIAECPLLFYPHRRGEDHVGYLSGPVRIDV